MPVFLDTTSPEFEAAFQTLLSAKREDSPDVDAVVAGIIDDVRSLTGPEKAAILMLSLGEEHGRPLWEHLDEEEGWGFMCAEAIDKPT